MPVKENRYNIIFEHKQQIYIYINHQNIRWDMTGNDPKLSRGRPLFACLSNSYSFFLNKINKID